MKVVLTGGGTGGHIYPAIAIGKKIEKEIKNSSIVYIGCKKGLESEIVPKENIKFYALNTEGLSRKMSLQNVRAFLKFLMGILLSVRILHKEKPKLVIGTGGFVSAPVLLAARVLGIPTAIHEQNAYPGLANRLAAKFTDLIMLNFKEAASFFKAKEKIKITGLPVREDILKISKEEGRQYFSIRNDLLTILVTGGSRGAEKINNVILDSYEELLELPIQIIHITGSNNYENIKKKLSKKNLSKSGLKRIILKPYVFDMQYAISAADLCISRAGATFLSEITNKGVPSILIPYPYATENHQEKNAEVLVKAGSAEMILNKELDKDKLLEKVESIILNKDKLENMAEATRKNAKPKALDNILECIEGFFREGA